MPNYGSARSLNVCRKRDQPAVFAEDGSHGDDQGLDLQIHRRMMRRFENNFKWRFGLHGGGEDAFVALINNSVARGEAVDGGVHIAREDFSRFLWDINGPTLQNSWREQGDVPVATPTADAMAKALKAKGFKFCGPVIVYAFMQAVGMVNDHLVTCHRHEECRRMAV